jgi:tRNA(fMet)-specific endonuclease VapC
MSYLLDTNICIHLFKGHEPIVQKIDLVGIQQCYLSELSIAELMFGVENSALNRQQENRKNLEWLSQAFAGRILPISGAFQEYAVQKVALRRAGKPTGEIDLFIGATAIFHNLVLVTRNTKDFTNLEGIQLENWIDS